MIWLVGAALTLTIVFCVKHSGKYWGITNLHPYKHLYHDAFVFLVPAWNAGGPLPHVVDLAETPVTMEACVYEHTHTHTHRYMSNMTETQSLYDYNALNCTYRLERARSNIMRNVISPVCVRSWPLQVISSHTLPVADMQREPATF